MEQKKVSIQKNGITKKVDEKDVKDYVADGWVVLNTITNPYDFNTTSAFKK